MHLWLDRRSGVVAFWVVGPPLAISLQSANVPEMVPRACWYLEDTKAAPGTTPLAEWRASLGDGSWKKARAHWIVTTVLVAVDNFCAVDDRDTTPAMRAGWTTRPWRPEELAANMGTASRGIFA